MSKPLKTSLAALLIILVSFVFLGDDSGYTLKVMKAAELQNPTQTPATGSASHDQLRQLLLERKRILDEIAEDVRKSFEAGRTSVAEYVDAKTASLTAGIDFCETKDERVKIYADIVKLHEESEAWTKRRFERGRAGQLDLNKVRVVRIESEIDLLREKLR